MIESILATGVSRVFECGITHSKYKGDGLLYSKEECETLWVGGGLALCAGLSRSASGRSVAEHTQRDDGMVRRQGQKQESCVCFLM